MKIKRLFFMAAAGLIGIAALSGCVSQPVTAEEPAVTVESTAQVVDDTATEEVSIDSHVGGTLIEAVLQEPDTLDSTQTNFAVTISIVEMMGMALVSQNMDGEYIPYGAESWDASDDGLVWTFHLRQGITFHNGDPVTADDWVYTFERMRSPDIVSPVAAGLIEPVATFEAADDFTLVMTLNEPFYPFLNSLASSGYMGVISQRAVEELGEQYGTPAGGIVGAGPFMFQEWIQDEKIVLTRNPDYTWGPLYYEGVNTGPYYIENLEFRIIPDYSTILAALASGDIHSSGLQPQDVADIQSYGTYDVIAAPSSGTVYMEFNLSKPPFDDILIRQAFNYALDRQAIIDVVLNGQGTPVQSILSSAVAGYWPGVEQIGYQRDVEMAKQLVTEAGYTFNADGMAEKDGALFEVTLWSTPDDESVKVAQLLAGQLAEAGITLNIETLDWGVLSGQLAAGDYELTTMGIGYNEADLLYIVYHSSQGWWNFINDPELDALLDLTRTETDPAARQQAVNAALTRIVENAYCGPLYSSMGYEAISSDIEGYVFSEKTGAIYFNDAYFSDLP